MAIDFNSIRSRKGTQMESLQKKLEQNGQTGGFKKDDRFWTPTYKDRKSTNIIRFLPIPFIDMEAAENPDSWITEEDLTPMALVKKHFFNTPGGYFIENSLSTFGDPCPVHDHDRPLWVDSKKLADGPEKTAIQNKLKPRLPNDENIMNVYIVRDANAPEKEGKVFLYNCPKTIYKMIKLASSPEFETDIAFDAFDFFEGADLCLNLTQEKKFFFGKEHDVPVFTNVKWAPPSPFLGGNEADMDRIWREEYSIAEFYNRKNFKTYEVLKEKFERMMGISGTSSSASEVMDKMEQSSSSERAAENQEKTAVKNEEDYTHQMTDEEQSEIEKFEAMLGQ